MRYRNLPSSRSFGTPCVRSVVQPEERRRHFALKVPRAHAEPIASRASLCLAQVAAWSSRRRQQIERGIPWAAAKTSRKNRSEKGKNAYNASLSPSPRKIKEVTEDFQTSLLSKNSKTQDFQPSLLSKTSQVHSKNYLPSLSL